MIPYRLGMTYHLVTTSFEIGVCPWPDLSSLFQYTSPTPIVSLHLISRILYHPGIPVTLLTGSSLYQIFAWIFTTPKLITSEAKDLSGSLSSFIIVLKLLLLESVVLARRRNAVDAMSLVTALYPISVAQAQSTFLTASEKAPSNRLLLSCFALKRFQRPILPSAPRLTCTLGGHSNLGSYRVI